MSTGNFTCFFKSNLSHDSLTPFEWDLAEFEGDLVLNSRIVGTIMILFFLIGVPWNILVLISIVKTRLYSQPSSILLLSLAITDLLVCLLIMPFNIITGIAGEFIFGNNDYVRCQVCQLGFLITFLVFLSLFTVTLISIDRLIYLLSPFKYKSIVTTKRVLLALSLVWLLCFVISILPLFRIGQIDFGLAVGTCVVSLVQPEGTQVRSNFYYILGLLVEAVLVILVLIVVNIWIVVIVQKNIITVYKLRRSVFTHQPKKNAPKINKTQLYLFRAFGAIVLTNLVTWFPLMGVAILSAVVEFDQVPTQFITFSYMVFISQSFLHPILESMFVKDIRILIFNHFRCTCCRNESLPKHLPDIGTQRTLNMRVSKVTIVVPPRQESNNSFEDSNAGPGSPKANSIKCFLCGLFESCSTSLFIETRNNVSSTPSP